MAGDVVEADEAQVFQLGGYYLGDLGLDRLIIEHAGELQEHGVEESLMPAVRREHVKKLIGQARTSICSRRTTTVARKKAPVYDLTGQRRPDRG